MTAPACARLGVGLIAFGLSLAAGADDSSPSATLRHSAADHDDSYLYRLPYGNEASFSVLQTFGSRLSHRGSEYYTIDFGMPEGTIVFSAREGTIVDIEDRFDRSCWAADCAGYANYIVIRHPDQTLGKYFHLQQDSIVVEPGQWVERGVPIARSGDTGYATSPHLHFGVYQPLEDGGDRSIAIQFAVRGGFVGRLRAGGRYTNRID
jgi:murein DD-endopeptidase MepM/ murein hydrolase activator NlpD